MSNRSAARGRAAASSIRLTLRTSNAVATSSASPSRCFLFCDGSRAARSARTAAATVSTPPIPKAPPNQRRSPPTTSTFQAARVSDGWQGGDPHIAHPTFSLHGQQRLEVRLPGEEIVHLQEVETRHAPVSPRALDLVRPTRRVGDPDLLGREE